jgi:WD40 repeat protein
MEITSAEVVATVRLFRQRDMHPADTGKSLLHRSHKYLAQGLDRRLAVERARVIVTGHIDYLLERKLWDEASLFLTSFSYLSARLAFSGIRSVLDDFRRFLRGPAPPNADVKAVFESLSIAQPILEAAPSQLAEQLLARLPEGANQRIASLRRNAEDSKPGGAWLRPLHNSFTGPGQGVRYVCDDHAGVPTAVTFSSDGSFVIYADEIHLYLRDSQSHELVAKLPGPGEEVLDLAAVAGGRIVAACRCPALFVWTLPGGGAPERLPGHASPVHTLLGLENGQVLSGSSDGSIRLWDLDCKSSEVVGRGEQPIRSLARLPHDAGCVSAAAHDFGASTLTTWDLHARRPTHSFEHEEAIDSIALSPDGRILLAAANRTLLRFDFPLRTPPSIVGVHELKITRVIAGADGDSAVSADTGGALRVWNLRRSSPPHRLRGHRYLAHGIALGTDSLASVGMDRTLRLWTFPPPNAVTTQFAHDSAITGLSAFRYAGRSLAVSASDDATLAIWDLDVPTRISQPMRHAASVSGVAAIPARGQCVSAGWDGRISVWELPTGKEIGRLSVPHVHFVAIAVDNNANLAATATFDGRLRFWDLSEMREVSFQGATDGHVTCIAFADGGKRLVAAGDGWKTVVFSGESRESGRLTNELHLPLDPSIGSCRVNAVCSLPDSPRFILATTDGQLVQLDTSTNSVAGVWQYNRCGVADVAASPCGRWIASVGSRPTAMSDDTIRIWDSRSGKVRSRFIADGPLTSCAFYSSNHLIVGDSWGRLHLFAIEPNWNIPARPGIVNVASRNS